MNSALYTLIIVCHGLWLLFIIHPRVISIYDNYLLYTGEGNPNRNFSTHKYVIYMKLLQRRIHMNVDFVATLVNSILNVKRTYSEDKWRKVNIPKTAFFFLPRWYFHLTEQPSLRFVNTGAGFLKKTLQSIILAYKILDTEKIISEINIWGLVSGLTVINFPQVNTQPHDLKFMHLPLKGFELRNDLSDFKLLVTVKPGQ